MTSCELILLIFWLFLVIESYFPSVAVWNSSRFRVKPESLSCETRWLGSPLRSATSPWRSSCSAKPSSSPASPSSQLSSTGSWAWRIPGSLWTVWLLCSITSWTRRRWSRTSSPSTWTGETDVFLHRNQTPWCANNGWKAPFGMLASQ